MNTLFEQVYTSWEQNKEKQKFWRLLAEHKTSLGNMEDEILGFQFKPVSAKPTHPSCKFQKLRHLLLDFQRITTCKHSKNYIL